MAETQGPGDAQTSGLVSAKVKYWQRIFQAYFGLGTSQLTFWHDHPRIDERAFTGKLGEYYQDFSEKADYAGHYDTAGIPLLDYRGTIGKQYNPIAIAQYGLGNYNLSRYSTHDGRRDTFLRAAGWLVKHLEANKHGVPVWHHQFDWEYREILRAPWYSALAQGQGISLLLRAFLETRGQIYLDTAHQAFRAFLLNIDEGGVSCSDTNGHIWFEEYLVSPPSHVLNGFIWALWGVYDYHLATQDLAAGKLFQDGVRTLAENLWRYDTGFWSLYDLGATWLQPLASPFYHNLHITQLTAMHRLTGHPVFHHYATIWNNYQRSFLKRNWSLAYKMLFKLLYY